MWTKQTFSRWNGCRCSCLFNQSQQITNIATLPVPLSAINVIRLCQRPKFRKVAAGTDLLRAGHIRMCGPTYPARHEAHKPKYSVTCRTAVCQHTNWCRQAHTRTSPNACCHLVLHSLFVFPPANGKYKYLKYRITILQAFLHGWSKQQYGLRVFDSRLLVILDRRSEQVTPEWTMLYNAEPDCLYTAPHTIRFSVAQQPPHCWGFYSARTHTRAHTHDRAPLNEWSARRTGRYLHNTEPTQDTNIHVPCGIRTRSPSNRGAIYLRLNRTATGDRSIDLSPNMIRVIKSKRMREVM